jgi:hypothetical protein
MRICNQCGYFKNTVLIYSLFLLFSITMQHVKLGLPVLRRHRWWSK